MEPKSTPHNLGLYRLLGFSGMRRELLMLHDWLTGGDDLPAIAMSGEQGAGKSTLSTAAAWNHFHHFTDGIIRVSPAGTSPFRIYDVVRTLDTVLGTSLTRTSEERWGISILEQLYKRRRLLILDKLAGATPKEIDTLVGIIGHLHENEGQSRILLIDRNFSPAIANLVQDQHLHLPGIVRSDLAEFVWRRAPDSIRTIAVDHVDELFEVTKGSPLSVRFVLGLLLDFGWDELLAVLSDWAENTKTGVPAQGLCVLAVENYALQNPAAAVLLGRMSHAVGGVTYAAMRELFWEGLGSSAAFDTTLSTLGERGLLELDSFNLRAFIHPIVRRYLTENAPMLGEEWDRRHAVFYLGAVQQYQHLPLERWSEVDMDWGNIYVGADWCAHRAERIWERSAMEMIGDPTLDQTAVAAEADSPENYADLCLARDYALALADYAFWRHPPGIVRWLAVGAVAAFATQDMRNYGWFLMNIGRQMFFLGRLPEAIQWLDRARPIFDERDLLAELAYVHTDLGTTYRVLDEPRHALEHFLVAFDCTAQLGDTRGLATAYMNLGSAQFSLGQHDRALAEQRKALRVALRLNDRHLIASAYNNMGLSLEAMEHFDEATHVYEHALRTFQQNNDQIGVSACFNNLGSVSYAQGNFGRALTWYERDRALLQDRGAWTDMAATLHNLGHVALEQHEFLQALAFFTQSRDLYAAFDLNDYVEEEIEMIQYVQEQKPARG